MSHPTADDSESRPISSMQTPPPGGAVPPGVFVHSEIDFRHDRQPGKDRGGALGAPALSDKHKVRLAVSELKIGMFVCELDRPWLESPFGFQGFPLRSVEDIQAVKRVCAYVFVDTEKSVGGIVKRRAAGPAYDASHQVMSVGMPDAALKPVPRWLPGTLRARAVRRASSAAAVHSLEVAQRAYEQTNHLVRSVMRDARWGRSIDALATREAISACADQVTRDPTAMVLLASIKDKDQYTAQHSLNVAILSMVLGHHLGLPKRTLSDLGAGGLLHDIGKVLVPQDILKKPGRLDPAELNVVRMHTVHGKSILEGCDGVGRAPMEVAYSHHERLDGSGYPRGIKEGDMGILSRIVAITDTYDALTSERVYAQATTSIEAFKILQASSGNHYDGQLVSELISVVGIFPPGSTVQLNNGKYGAVVRTNPRYEFRPTVLVLKDAKCRPIKPFYIDLADVSGANASHQIARLVRPADCGIDSAIFGNHELLADLVS